MYFRKVIGVKLRSIRKATVLQGRAIVHDFFAYLVDSQHLEEALSVSQVGPPSSPPTPHLFVRPSSEWPDRTRWE